MNNHELACIAVTLLAILTGAIGFMIGWSEGRRAFVIEENEREERKR